MPEIVPLKVQLIAATQFFPPDDVPWETDADALAATHLASWRAAYAHLVPAEAFDTVDVSERAARWRQRARDDVAPTGTLVAEDDGGLVGFVSFGVPRLDDPPAPAEVYAVYAVPSAWGTGLGARLLDEALDRVGGSAYLWVLRDNPRARRFYEKAGFVFDGTTTDVDFLGHSLPEVRYVHPGRRG